MYYTFRKKFSKFSLAVLIFQNVRNQKQEKYESVAEWLNLRKVASSVMKIAND